MEGPLVKLLDSRSLDILYPDHEIYADSLFRIKQYLHSVIGSRAGSNTVHTTGFDADQIWEQTKVALTQVPSPAHCARPVYVNPSGRCPTKAKIRKARNTRQRNENRLEELDIIPNHARRPNIGIREGQIQRLGREEPVENVDSALPGCSSSGGGDTPNSNPGASYDSRNTRASVTGELEDGFFGLEKFNIETERFERADMLGLSIDRLDAEIDWNADPGDDENESRSGRYRDGASGLHRNYGHMYSDFFLAPKTSTMQGDGGQSPRADIQIGPAGHKDDLNAIMHEIQQDLFEESLQDIGDDKSESGHDESWQTPNLINSSHQKNQAMLSDEIRMLEKQNVNRREWALSGETDSQRRPFNSLLEEDFDFERVGKPVPVITQDVTVNLEDIIKSRILAGQYDEIERRDPRSLVSVRRERAPGPILEDSKSGTGLADVYEKERLEPIGKNAESTSVKLTDLRNEISGLFSRLTNELDLLSSWHFTPKPLQPVISVVHDSRRIDMEESNINTSAGSTSRPTKLAPHEIYDPADTRHQTKGVVKATGVPISMAEMERSQRAKEKRRRKKRQLAHLPEKITSNKTQNRRDGDLIKALGRGKVSIIGKDGERAPVSGKAGAQAAALTGARVKL
ncbi:hypothetical protein DRE_05043 [Drechslerella stenobrocha 248]|uniref:U3 small nucleolar ribonucleoprotein protein MPP10 n=1 Tax=Drechslerella stenobrocha 248 TaxID=1043628 RepID=W7HNQ3_9PEZI|nr:hypothetical protein DRE_05043 [Drechslerella stenobrocha 248]